MVCFPVTINPEKKKEMAKKVGDLKRRVPIWNGNKPHPMKGKVHPNRNKRLSPKMDSNSMRAL